MTEPGRERHATPAAPRAIRASAPARRPDARPSLLRLQGSAGNRAVVQLLATHHLAAQAPPRVQRAIKPEDLTVEMRGAHFKVTEAVTVNGVALKVGETIEITAWDNMVDTASARQLPPAPPAVQFQVPKKLLRPVASGVAGIAQYGAGVSAAAKDFEKGEAKIAAENARKGGTRPDEVKRLADLQKNRLTNLNKKLIQGSFLNRFDGEINTWVGFYNAKFGFKGADSLDPNLVKAMLYQETQMGTEGEFLEVPTAPDAILKTRQNVLQNIDSGAEALLEMIPEEDPAIAAKYDFPGIRKALAKVTDTEDFLRNNKPFTTAVNEFFANVPAGSPARNADYGFWIKSGVRWLFHKRQSRKIKSWEEAARAYNGGGPDARKYKREVIERMKAAKKAEAGGTEYVPIRL